MRKDNDGVTRRGAPRQIPLRKLQICQVELENQIDGKKFYSGAIVRDDRVLVLSRTQDPRVDITSFAANLKRTYLDYESKNDHLGGCLEITFRFLQKSIFIRKLNDLGDSNSPLSNQFWLVLILNPSKRNFKERINQLSEDICKTLFT